MFAKIKNVFDSCVYLQAYKYIHNVKILKEKILVSYFLFMLILLNKISCFAVDSISEKWTKSLKGSDNDKFEYIQKTSDGGYIAVGQSESSSLGITIKGGYDAIIVKYNENFDIEWINSFGGSLEDNFLCVTELSDGSFVATGDSWSKDIGFEVFDYSYDYCDAIIVKYDENGKEIWATTLPSLGNSRFRELVEVEDGSVITVGFMLGKSNYFSETGLADAIIVKYDKTGNVIWIKKYGGSSDDDFFSIKKVSQGFVVAGYIGSSDSNLPIIHNNLWDATIIKFDNDMNVIWINSLNGNGDEYFRRMEVTKSGDFIVAGLSSSTDLSFKLKGANDAIIAKYSKDGNLEWVRNIGGSSDDVFWGISELNNGNIVAVGGSLSNDSNFVNNGGFDAILAEYDENGNELLFKNYGKKGDDYFKFVIETNDKNLIIVGYSDLDESGKTDGVIVEYEVYYPIIETKSTEALKILYLIPENTLELSLDTNQIVFENFSYIEDTERLNAIMLTVSSTLPYNIKAYLENDIIGANYGEKIDNSLINLKANISSEYKSFSDTVTSFNLLENQSPGNKIAYGIDMKLKGSNINRFDIYKAVIKLQIEQV